MKYTIKDAQLNSLGEIIISAEEFDSIKNAKMILSAGLSMEEAYELLLGNYEDLEKEVVSISVENILHHPKGYNDFHSYIARLNKRLVNFLTAACLYREYFEHLIPEITMKDSKIKAKIDALFKKKRNEYDEFEFMKNLRNHTQHYGLPVHRIEPRSWVRDVDDLEKGLVYTIDLFSGKRWLEDNKRYWKELLPKLDDKTDLKMAIRKYVECLSEIQSEIRQIVSGNLVQARQLIEDCINRFNEKFKQQTKALLAIASDDNGNEVDEVVLLLDWDNIRIDLADKNRVLKNLSLMCVTGETKIT